MATGVQRDEAVARRLRDPSPGKEGPAKVERAEEEWDAAAVGSAAPRWPVGGAAAMWENRERKKL